MHHRQEAWEEDVAISFCAGPTFQAGVGAHGMGGRVAWLAEANMGVGTRAPGAGPSINHGSLREGHF